MKLRNTVWMAAGVAVAATAGFAAPAMAQKEISIIRTIDTDRYDPHRSTARSAAEILFMVGDTLVALDYDLKTVKPGLAKSWSVSEDGKTYTFNLKEGVKFCSGKEFTAQDVVDNINRWRDPATKGVVTWRAGPVKEVRAKDKLTVEYELTKPYSELLFQMTQHFHTIINVDQAKELGDDFGVKALDATGPFCFQSWEPRNQTVLTKHKGYNWGPDFYKNKEAQVDKITWKIVPEESTRVASLQTGQADASQYVPYWSLDQFKANSRMSVTQAEAYFWTYFLGFKITRDLMQDVRVRQAMNLAVDVEAITEAVTFGYATPANTMISPDVVDFDKSVKTDTYTYDPVKAAALLDEAGWKLGADGFRYKDGKKLAPLVYGFTDTWRQIVEAVQGDLRKVGIDLQIQLFDATVVWGKLATQEFDVFTMSFPYVSTGDAMNLYFRSANMPTPNRVNWDDKETDALLETGSAALTEKERAEAFGKVLHKVHDAAVWIPMYHEPLYTVAGAKMQPVRAHGIYGAGFYKGIDLAMK